MDASWKKIKTLEYLKNFKLNILYVNILKFLTENLVSEGVYEIGRTKKKSIAYRII